MAPLTSEPVRTFSVGFAEARGQRAAYARLAARAAGRRAPRGRRVAGRVLRGAAAARLARGRADRVPVERAALLRLAAGARAREGGADGRGRRRALPRLQPLPRDGVERAARPRATGRSARRRCAHAVRAAVPPLPRRARRYATRSFLALPAGPRGLFFENFAVFPRRCSAGSCAEPRAAGGARPLRDRARCVRRGGRRRARPHEPRRHPDLPGRAADEAGPDEHGGLDREPRAVPRPRPRGARGRACRARLKLRGWRTKAVLREAVRGRRAARDPRRAGRWDSRSRWAAGSRQALLAAGRGVRARAARAAPAASSTPRALARLAAEHRAGAADHGERLWLLAQPRDLAARLRGRRGPGGR